MSKKKSVLARRPVPPPKVATLQKADDDRRDAVNDENQPPRGKQKKGEAVLTPMPVSKNKKKGPSTSSKKKKKKAVTVLKMFASPTRANASPDEVSGADSDADDGQDVVNDENQPPRKEQKEEEEDDAVFLTPTPVSKNKTKGSSTSSTKTATEPRKISSSASSSRLSILSSTISMASGVISASYSEAVDVPPNAHGQDVVNDENQPPRAEKEEDEDDTVFLTPMPVSKNKNKGSSTSSAKKTATSPRKSISSASSSRLSSVSSTASASDSDAEAYDVPLYDYEGEKAEEALARMYKKHKRLSHERGTINARVDMAFPDLVKEVPDRIPFLYTSKRVRMDIERRKKEIEVRIAKRKTNKVEREKEAAALRNKMYKGLKKKMNKVNEKIAVIFPLAEAEKLARQAREKEEELRKKEE